MRGYRAAHLRLDRPRQRFALRAQARQPRVRGGRRFSSSIEHWQRQADTTEHDAIAFLFRV